MSTVNIDFRADAAPLVAAAARATAALNSIGASADNASKKVTPAMGNLSGGAQKAAAAMGPLGGVLAKISPDAGAAAAAMAGAAAAAQGLSGALLAATGSATLLEVAMGPVGLALAAVTAVVAGAVLVYKELEGQAADTAAAQKVLADSADVVAAAEGRIAEAKYKLRVATGAVTAAEVRRQAEAKENLIIAAADLELGHEVARLQNKIAADNEAGSIKAAQASKEQLDDALKKRQELQATGAVAARLAGDEAEAAFKKKEDDEAAAAAAIKKKESDEAAAAGAADAAASALALKAAVDAVAAAERALQDITQASTDSTLDAMGKEEAAYHRKNLAIEANREAALRALQDMGAAEDAYAELQAANLDAQTAALQEHESNVAQINREKAQSAEDALAKEEKDYAGFLERQAKLEEEANAKALSDAEAGWAGKMEIAEGYYAAATQLAGLWSEATSKSYDTTTEAGKAAATKQFYAQKAVAMALSIAQGALAVIQAFGSAPPPFNIPAILATAIAVTAATATIAATQPKFHMGTTGGRPDEYSATLQRGEGVVTAAGMSKPGMKETVAAANSGRTPGGANGAMNIQYQHKVYNEFIRDNLRAGSPLTRRIDSGTKVGHRQSRS